MTPEAQRIAIAEACGWTKGETSHPRFGRDNTRWISPSQVKHLFFPDFLTDLNAMHEAEKVLTKQQGDAMSAALIHKHFTRAVEYKCPADARLWHANAAQRAEAFLRAIGKWIE